MGLRVGVVDNLFVNSIHILQCTLAKSDVFPPSTGPTSRAVAGPPLLVVLLPPVVTDISEVQVWAWGLTEDDGKYQQQPQDRSDDLWILEQLVRKSEGRWLRARPFQEGGQLMFDIFHVGM